MNISNALKCLSQKYKEISDLCLITSDNQMKFGIRIRNDINFIDLDSSDKNIEIANAFKEALEKKVDKDYLYNNYYSAKFEDAEVEIRIQSIPTILGSSDNAYTAIFRLKK